MAYDNQAITDLLNDITATVLPGARWIVRGENQLSTDSFLPENLMQPFIDALLAAGVVVSGCGLDKVLYPSGPCLLGPHAGAGLDLRGDEFQPWLSDIDADTLIANKDRIVAAFRR